MKNIIKSRAFLLLVFTLICIIMIVISSNDLGNLDWISSAALKPFAPLQALFSKLTATVTSNFAIFSNIDKARAENEELRARVEELEKQNRELTAERDKFGEIHNLLNLKSKFVDYTFVGGNVITREAGNWFSVFKIDRGKSDGIAEDMPVVSSNMALIGRTIDVGMNTSKVITLIDEGCVVSGWIRSQEGGLVVVRGDITLKEQGYCRIDLIPGETEVSPGDIIETSGIGGIFPREIEIGTVLSVMQTGNGLLRYAIVEPFADLKRIDEVFVMYGFSDEMEAGAVDSRR
ncbi:MAG: rod shape-determining protein MreC [Oscillospiraceae bacterium]|nr:rod shape-determining protein MreC [Oscillospiraceae bacterium]